MFNKIYWKIADFERDESLSPKLRLKRISLFKKLIYPLPKPIKILDVGGTEIFWEKMGFCGDKNTEITALNLSKIKTHCSNLESIVGDGRDMKEFRDKEFDIVFSNSVIEHLGDYNDQIKMAKEIQRVGKRYFIQTPNFYSPIEPHFFFPLFQFLPFKFKVFMLRHFNLGYLKKTPNKQKAEEIIKSIRLLKKREIEELFPGSIVQREKVLGFTLSFIVYKW